MVAGDGRFAMTVLVAVQVPMLGDERGKHWAKVVTGVDTSSSSGWAYQGDFVSDGGIQDLPAGSVLLVYGERGSRMSPVSEAKVYRVNGDGTLTHQGGASGRAWARTLRDTIAALLEQPMPATGWLLGASDRELAEELERRGWKLTPPA
jgi:hypothetical protein